MVVLTLLGATFACGQAGHAQNTLLTNAATSLINRKAAFLNGWAWQDIEQVPNYYQGDSDVGTSSIGTAFLDMYNATGSPAYLNAAEEAANWLVSAQTSAGWWPDYDNPSSLSPSGPANYGFSSLDDGASGQAIFLYRMYRLTGNPAYETAALDGADWLVSYASAPHGQSCPSQQCFWHWWVPSSNGKIVYLGLGSGVARVFYGLDKLAQWTGNGIYEEYALAGAAYEENKISSTGSTVEYAGANTSSTAFYDGAAGIAFAYYSLYQHTGTARWLADANKIMAWVRSQEIAESSGVVWPHQVGGDSPDTANYPSMAYGNAGIGWAELQAYKITGASVDLQTAEAAGDYLVVSEQSQSGGCAWEEPFGTTNYYTSEDEGAAGIGYFLYDLHLATGTASYNRAALAAAKWIQAQAFSDSDGYYWGVNNYVGNGGWQSLKEPSRDWGAAGIGMFGARLSGGPDDQPRDVAGLTGSSSPSFMLLASPSSVTVTQGATGGTSTITVIDVGGFTDSVTLTASGLPNGVTASFSTNPTTSTSSLTLTANSSAMTGTARLTITGASGGLTANTAITLTIKRARHD